MLRRPRVATATSWGSGSSRAKIYGSGFHAMSSRRLERGNQAYYSCLIMVNDDGRPALTGKCIIKLLKNSSAF